MRERLLAVLACAIFVVGCSDVRRTELPRDISQWDGVKPTFEKLTPEERDLMAAYAVRKTMQGTIFGQMAGDTTARTIGEAIENQRRFVADHKTQAAGQRVAETEAKAKREGAMQALRQAVSVSITDKKVDVERGRSGMELDQLLVVTFTYKNNTSKEMAGVKGTIKVLDLFGDELSAFAISNDSTIAPGASSDWKGSRSIKYGFGSHKNDEKFATLPAEKYKVVWEPEAIVFSDGTRLEAPKR